MKTKSWWLENESVSDLSKAQLLEIMHSFQENPLPYRFNLHLPTCYTFAPEIEFQLANRLTIQNVFQHVFDGSKNSWSVSADSSVCHATKEIPTELFEDGTYGGEIAPQYLTDQKASWEQLRRACLLLTKFGAVASKLTSIHVNIGAHIFQGNPQLVENLLSLWIAFEPEIFQFGMGNQSSLRPRAFEFSYPLTPLLLEPYQTTGSWLESYQMAIDHNDSKSIALNLFLSPQKNAQQFFLGNRIELRNFNGSLHPTTVQTNLLFSLYLVKYCVSDHFQTNMISAYLDDLKQPYPATLYQDGTKRNLQKGLLLCDLIFNTTLDKLYFLNQWIRPSQEPSSITKKKSLVF